MMPYDQTLRVIIEADIRSRLCDRRFYRRQRDLAIGRARTWEGAMEAARGWGSDAKQNDAVLRALVRLVREARRTAVIVDAIDAAKAYADWTEGEKQEAFGR